MEMLSLLIQDIYKNKLNLSIYLFGVLILSLIGGNLSIIALVVIFLFPMKISQANCLENDLYNSNKFYGILPLKRNDIVVEKHMLFMILILSGVIIYTTTSIIRFGLNEYVMCLLLLVPIMVLNQCIYFMSFFRYGAIYATGKCKKFYIILFIFIIFIGKITQVYNIKTDFIGYIYHLNYQSLILISIFVTLGILTISIKKSTLYYITRDI